MKPNELFLKLPKTFWASVRLISQDVGYTEKGTNRIRVPSREQIKTKLERREIDFDKIQ